MRERLEVLGDAAHGGARARVGGAPRQRHRGEEARVARDHTPGTSGRVNTVVGATNTYAEESGCSRQNTRTGPACSNRTARALPGPIEPRSKCRAGETLNALCQRWSRFTNTTESPRAMETRR